MSGASRLACVLRGVRRESMKNLQSLPPALKDGMKILQSLLPALIVSLALLVGLLVGAKIISNGIVEANRFQFAITGDNDTKCFDSVTGYVFRWNGLSWEAASGSGGYKDYISRIRSAGDWANYVEVITPRALEYR
jgi:hypothetical protein